MNIRIIDLLKRKFISLFFSTGIGDDVKRWELEGRWCYWHYDEDTKFFPISSSSSMLSFQFGLAPSSYGDFIDSNSPLYFCWCWCASTWNRTNKEEIEIERKKRKRKWKKKFSSCQMLFVLSKHQHDDERCVARLTFSLPFIVLIWVNSSGFSARCGSSGGSLLEWENWKLMTLSLYLMIVCARLRRWKKVVNPPSSWRSSSICGVKKGFSLV